MRISWISDSGIRIETSQGLILYNHGSNALTTSSQKDENTIAIFPNQSEKANAEKKLLSATTPIYEPGEYEVKGVPIQGFAIKINDSDVNSFTTIYSVISEKMNICLINETSNISIPAAVSESIGKLDVLALVCNPKVESSLESVNSIVSNLEPSVLVPVETGSSSETTDVYPKIIKELGQTQEESIGKGTISKSGAQEMLKVLNLRKTA